MTRSPVKVAFMENLAQGKQIEKMMRELYPTLSDAELKEVETNLRRYLEIVMEMQEERTVRDTDFDSPPSPTNMRERSNANLKS